MIRSLPHALLLSSIITTPPLAAASTYEVNVNVRLTDAGKGFVAPTPERPLFYLPVVAGYHIKGPRHSEEPPAPRTILETFATALARHGYLPCKPKLTPRPSLLLVFQWGVVNRDVVDETTEVEVVRNKNELRTLVTGESSELNFTTIELDWMEADLQSDRSFALVAAYDYAAAERGQKKLLWISRMSMPAAAPPSLDLFLPKLIAAGAPFVGRETRYPQILTVSVDPPGKVDVGTPVVVPETPAKK